MKTAAPAHFMAQPGRKGRAAPLPDCGDALARLHRRGTDITRDHLAAAARLRAAWAAGGGDGPAVQAALAAVGRSVAPLVLWAVIHQRDLKSWTALPIHQGKPDPAKQLGRLVFALGVLRDLPLPPGEVVFATGATVANR